MDLLCIGLVTLDIAASPIDALPPPDTTTLIEAVALSPAGTAGGAALVAARLGVSTGLAGSVGADAQALLIRALLAAEGVDTTLLAELPIPTSTTILAIDSSGQRPCFHALGATHGFELTPPVIAAAERAHFVHWAAIGAPRIPDAEAAALLAAARAGGATVTCDLIAPQPGAAATLAVLLPHIDYFMPSAAEALYLSGTADIDAAADHFLALGAGACIIKNGRDGALLALADGRRETIAAHDIVAVDTTSCGDSFCAGFIAAMLRGWEVRDACRFAAATAALVAGGMGTLGLVASFEATATAMGSMPLRGAA